MIRTCAINQHFLRARMFKNRSLRKLDEHEHEHHESIDGMRHADKLVERILFLEGLPNLQDLGTLRIGENPREILECELALEHDAAPLLREVIAHAESVGDYVSRELCAWRIACSRRRDERAPLAGPPTPPVVANTSHLG